MSFGLFSRFITIFSLSLLVPIFSFGMSAEMDTTSFEGSMMRSRFWGVVKKRLPSLSSASGSVSSERSSSEDSTFSAMSILRRASTPGAGKRQSLCMVAVTEAELLKQDQVKKSFDNLMNEYEPIKRLKGEVDGLLALLTPKKTIFSAENRRLLAQFNAQIDPLVILREKKIALFRKLFISELKKLTTQTSPEDRLLMVMIFSSFRAEVREIAPNQEANAGAVPRRQSVFDIRAHRSLLPAANSEEKKLENTVVEDKSFFEFDGDEIRRAASLVLSFIDYLRDKYRDRSEFLSIDPVAKKDLVRALCLLTTDGYRLISGTLMRREEDPEKNEYFRAVEFFKDKHPIVEFLYSVVFPIKKLF